MKLSVDYERCCGHGRCYALAPELFESDDTGDPIVLKPVVDGQDLGSAELAVAACPEGAVMLKAADV